MVGHNRNDARTGATFSLIFPTYNAGAFLRSTWHAVLHFLAESPASWEALFVCDGCSDSTDAQFGELLRDAPENVKVLSYRRNCGKGYAVRLGMQAAQGRWRIFTDIDLAYDFDDVVHLAESLQAGADVAIASRMHPASRLVVPPDLQGYAFRRHLQSMVFSGVVRTLLPLPQRDTQAGLKGLSARAVEQLWPHLTCNGFGFDCELLVACQALGVPVTEVPVHVRYETRASTTSLGSMRRMLRELWHIRRSWVAGRRLPAPRPRDVDVLCRTKKGEQLWTASAA